MLKDLILKTKFLKLLYVEDDLKLLKETEIFLKKIFPIVISAKNGQEGLELYKKEYPDIIITDIKMPIMDGLKLSREIKKLNPKAEIIITSAYDDKNFLLEAFDIGVAQYLIKPIKNKKFIETIDKCVDIIIKQENQRYKSLDTLFKSEENLLLLINNKIIKFSNRAFLKFFNTNTIEEFNRKYNFFDEINIKENSQNSFNYLISNIDKHHQITISKDNKSFNFELIINRLPYNENEYTILLIKKIVDKKIVIKEKVSTKEKKIIEILKTIKEKNLQLNIFYFYKGLKIENKLKLLEIGNDFIKISLTNFELLSLKQIKKLFLYSNYLAKDLYVEVESIDEKEYTATIKKFQYIDNSPRFRKFIRVDAKDDVKIFNDDFSFSANLVDLSISSIALNSNFIPKKFVVNSNIYLKFKLKLENFSEVEINIDAKVIKIEDNKKSYKIICLIYPNKIDEVNISQYILKTQNKIIKNNEIKDIYMLENENLADFISETLNIKKKKSGVNSYILSGEKVEIIINYSKKNSKWTYFNNSTNEFGTIINFVMNYYNLNYQNSINFLKEYYKEKKESFFHKIVNFFTP